MRVKSPEYRSSVAIVELVDGRIRVKLPDTGQGDASLRRRLEGGFVHCLCQHLLNPAGNS